VAVIALGIFSGAAASDFPARPVTSIGPLAAGGGADIMLRAIASFVEDHLGKSFIATNKPGGGSTSAALEMLSKPADGYTIANLLSAGAAPEVYAYFREVPYTSADLEPVIRLGTFPYGFYVHKSAPWQTLEEFFADARKNPGKLSYGHTGRGVQFHLFAEAMLEKAGVKLREVPTKGASEVIQNVLGKHLDSGFGSTTAGKKYVLSGDLRMLALGGSKERLPDLPDVPTFAELGYEFGFPPLYMAMFVKKGTPEDVVRKLHDAVKATLEDPRFIEVANKADIPIVYGDADAVRADVQAEFDVIAPLLKRLGMSKE